jgi:hypothetical protein
MQTSQLLKQAKEDVRLAAVTRPEKWNTVAGEYVPPSRFSREATNFVLPSAAELSSIISSAACPIVATADYDEVEEDDEEEVEGEEEDAEEDSDDDMKVVG